VNRTLGPVPTWAIATTFLLSLIGLALSTYLTITHFGRQDLFCTENGVVNCAAVTNSARVDLLGIPVAFLGLGTYVVMTVLNSPWMWRAKNYWIHVARFVNLDRLDVFRAVAAHAELIIIDHICLYCTGVHIVTFALLIVLTHREPGSTRVGAVTYGVSPVVRIR
jgi:uncharacterized membrane protein